MPNSIEIFENTLLKQILRQGADSDRLNITPDSGELAYSNDTKRLFVGDGSTSGGILVGNVFKGSATNITTLAPGEVGDLAYDSDNNKLYILNENNGSLIGDWLLVGGVYSAANGTINLTSDNKLSVGLLSAGVIDPSLLDAPIHLNGSNQIALSATVPVDHIVPRNGTSVTLHPSLSVNGVVYNYLSGTPANGSVARAVNVSGNSVDLAFSPLSASEVSVNSITVTGLLTSTANGLDSTGTAVNPLTADIVIGTSPYLSCTNKYIRYDGELDLTLSTKGISATRNGAGNYTFNYDTLPTIYPYGNVSIIGSDNRGWQARITNIDDTSCDVQITALANNFLYTDAAIALKIET